MRAMRLMGLRHVGLALGIVVAACGGEEVTPPDGPDTLRDDLPPVPQGAERLVSPVFTVPAGDEVFMCLRIPYDVTEDHWVNRSVAYQSDGGHHTMLYYTIDGVIDDEPHECTDDDMGNIRFIGVGTADGIGIELPQDIALLIPAGAKIYTQAHYVNTTTQDLEVQDVVDLYLLPADKVKHKAGAYTEIDLGLELPPAQTTTRTVECNMPMEMNVPWMIPHMHEWGAHFKLEVIQGEETKTVYEADWEEALRDHFPVIDFEPHLTLTPQDRVRTSCTWNNDTPGPILYPKEMCATFLIFYPSPDGALLACDEFGNQLQP